MNRDRKALKLFPGICLFIWTNVKIYFVKDKNSDSKVQLKESHDVLHY